MSGTGKFFGGLLVGAAAGIVTGLLIAPGSGNQTRRNIVKKSRVYSQQAIDAVRQYLENLKNGRRGELSRESEEILNRLNERANTGYEGI